MAFAFGKQRRWRFRLSSLLFLMFCLCGLFAGYRVGYLEGKRGGAKAQLLVRAYPVADLVTPQPVGAATTADFKSLADAVRTTVAPESWKISGLGEGEIKTYAANFSLIVAQTSDVHEQIASMLGALRKAQRAAAAKPKNSDGAVGN